MNFTNPSWSKPVKILREASSQRSLRDADAVPKWWRRINEIAGQVKALVKTVSALQAQVAKMRRRIVGGGGNGISLQVILYGDPTKQGYEEGIFYKILDSDSIVTTGIVCAGSVTVKATAGLWICLKSVPALKNDGNDLAYYIPQIPDASGSLDPANANKYWQMFAPSQICDGMI